jgi:hypothetical protein
MLCFETATMLKRLFPRKFFLHFAAGRLDTTAPLTVAAKIRSFAQPTEVQESIELLGAGSIFQARGLVNTNASQHNLDWVWRTGRNSSLTRKPRLSFRVLFLFPISI